MLTRTWKKEFRRLHPDLDVDWKEVVAKYQLHFGSFASFQSSRSIGEATRSATSLSSIAAAAFVDDEDEDKVKGFRKWTAQTKHDLLETKRRLIAESVSASDFNRVLLSEFQKLHPDCMESTRSITAKLQAIEKEDMANNRQQLQMLNNIRAASRASSDEKHEEVPSVSIKVVSPPVPAAEASENPKETIDIEPSVINNSDNTEESVFNKEESNSKVSEDVVDAPESSSAEIMPSEEPVSSPQVAAPPPPPSPVPKTGHGIKGFTDWSLSNIGDFIDCMGQTHRLFKNLREKDSTGEVKQVQLLLDEWRAMFPDTTETIESILKRIKYIRMQKEVIRQLLKQRGLKSKVSKLQTLNIGNYHVCELLSEYQYYVVFNFRLPLRTFRRPRK
jgi:hypothetical protein